MPAMSCRDTLQHVMSGIKIFEAPKFPDSASGDLVLPGCLCLLSIRQCFNCAQLKSSLRHTFQDGLTLLRQTVLKVYTLFEY